jgi:hypothetical protein
MVKMSEVFWAGLYTALMGCILSLANTLYKSKCKKISCCGLHVDRDVELEEKELEFNALHGKSEQKASI